jgi:glycosyltransferase involved in cell wall biosynthesis
MRINIIVPFIPFKPGGGFKVMFEYANHLTSLGHSVTLYYPIRVAFIEQPFFKSLVKYFLYKERSSTALNWFELDNKVDVKCVFKINNKTIKDGDIIFSTWWSLMFEIKKLSASKGNVFNLIQDIENWTGFEDKVKLSYTIADPDNVVISDPLCNYITQKTGKIPLQIRIAVDDNIYFIKNPITLRSPYTICMMYSIEPRKGSKYGLEAFQELKLRYPSLKVILFSVANAPDDLPDWIEYYKNYPRLSELYNEASIFLSPSIQEGCALPPMEAMNCGCAVVCTNIDGHKEYAFDGETALLANAIDVNDMVEKISSLLENNELRIKIATCGNELMKNYTWNASALKLESFFYNAINNRKLNL